MPKFSIQVGRDARVHYTAEVEAETLEAAKSKLTRHGYDCPDHVVWQPGGVDEFDHVETCCISDAGTGEVLAFYSDYDGWEDKI